MSGPRSIWTVDCAMRSIAASFQVRACSWPCMPSAQPADTVTTPDGAKALLERKPVPKSASSTEPTKRGAVRLAHKYGATVIKTCATGGVLSLADAADTPQLTQAELDALVDEAHA